MQTELVRPPLRCLLLLHSSLTPLPGQWDRCQSCKYILGATFVIISRNFLITHHKSFGCVTITCHDRKLVLWCAIAARVAFYSQPGLLSVWCVCVCVYVCVCVCVLFIYTISISIISVSQEEPSLIASNQQIHDFYKQIIFEKKKHCGK